MKRKQTRAVIGLFLVCTAVSAEQPQVGEVTQQWLELQKSGAQASEHARPLPGPVAHRNYERYLRSFERDIPDQFARTEKAK